MLVAQHWIYYALGGGMGHLTRAFSFCAAVRRWNRTRTRSPPARVSILANSPFLSDLPVESELVDPAVGAHHLLRLDSTDGRKETSEHVRQFIAKANADKLIVDTFPRGLGGELADLIACHPCQQILIHRNLSKQYCEEYGIFEFARNYDLLIQPGEFGPLRNRPRSFMTLPWLIRNHDELLSIDNAREKLGVVTNESIPVAVVVGCGRADEIQFLSNLSNELGKTFAGRLHTRFVSPAGIPEPHSKPLNWPLLECLPAVSILIGSGGYNTVHEARATGTPLLAFAQERMYDRQRERLTNAELCHSPSELCKRIEVALKKGFTRSSIGYQNGSDQAVELISGVTALQQQQ